MIKYEACTGMYRPTIVKHEVERETDKFVWINGRRTAKKSQSALGSQFFDTWKQAHNFLIDEVGEVYERAKDKYEAATAELNKVIEFVDPELEVEHE